MIQQDKISWFLLRVGSPGRYTGSYRIPVFIFVMIWIFIIHFYTCLVLFEMSHFQISKTKGNTVFKNLEITSTQRRVGWLNPPVLKRYNLCMEITIVSHVKEVSVYIMRCSKGLGAFLYLRSACECRVADTLSFIYFLMSGSFSLYYIAFDVLLHWLSLNWLYIYLT